MPTRRAAILALIGLAGFPHTALAAKSRFASSISRRKAKAEFQRVFRLITEGDFDALYAKGPVEFVVGQKILTEEEIRDFVSDIAAEAIASGQKFFQIDSFERTKSDLRYALFYATVEYRSRVDNYCYP